MKFLIYLACFIPYAIITTILSVNGIRLGGIPTVLLTLPFFFAAQHFWRLYAKKKEEKEVSNGNDEVKDTRASQIKFAQRVKATALSELEGVFACLNIQSAQMKFLIANQVEKQIMALSPTSLKSLEKDFEAGDQKQLILNQLKLSCDYLSEHSKGGDPSILNAVSAYLNDFSKK